MATKEYGNSCFKKSVILTDLSTIKLVPYPCEKNQLKTISVKIPARHMVNFVLFPFLFAEMKNVSINNASLKFIIVIMILLTTFQ